MSLPVPVITRRLGKLLTVVFLLFALMVVNSVYLAAITLLEATTGALYQDYFYLLMFLLHLVVGLLIILPVILFGLGHMRRALQLPNRYAIRAGLGLFGMALVLLVTGLLLTRFGFLEINHPVVRQTLYWIHVISPLLVAWLFVLHRLAGPAIRWRSGLHWAALAAGFAAVMVVLQTGVTGQEQVPVATDFAPSRALLASSESIPPAHLMTDEVCAECHADIAQTHAHSMHRFSSMNNPAYKFSVEETRRVVLERDGNVTASRFCAACHDPVPLFSGRFDAVDFDMDNDPTGQAGITCMSCHAMTSVNSTRGNGDYTLTDPPRYPFAHSESALLAEINQLLIRAKPAYHKKTLLKPFHRSAEFCSTCHKVSLDTAVNNYRWLRGQNHYDSFLQSGVAGHRVDSFYYPEQAVERCSKCHMPVQASDDPAARDFTDTGVRGIHSHLFPAANTGVAHLLGLPEEVIAAHQDRLTDVTRIDIFAIKEDGRIDGTLHAPLRPSLPVLEPGGRYLVEIVLRTTGVGHHLTEGTADSNQLWVELTARSGDALLGHSGAMDTSGQVDPWSYFVNSYVLDRNGQRIDRRNAQDVFIALYNHQIPPGAATVVHYQLDVPAEISGPVTLEAHLKYRKFDSTYLRHIQGDDFRCNDLPVTLMAYDRVTLPVAGRATVPVETALPVDVAERWNDYGIGLLREGGGGSGKGELRQAEHAFRQVERLGRSDGALNQARVFFREGRLDAAAEALKRAGQGDRPAVPWTIAWFTALIDRQNGHLVEAIETLETIVNNRFNEAQRRHFDFSRDVRVLNALGRSLYERARQLRGQDMQSTRDQLLGQARDWLHKTLVIDPENAAAHFNLSQVYARLGDETLAASHRQLHEQYRPDDSAIEQAVTRHRSENPAANHAASDVAIYPLARELAADGRLADAPHSCREPDLTHVKSGQGPTAVN
ncbi:MAG: multiheme c-type cytochrome [Gammaproteobacteria bacterium]